MQVFQWPLDEPPRALARAIADAGGDASRVHLFAIGARWRIPDADAAQAAPRP